MSSDGIQTALSRAPVATQAEPPVLVIEAHRGALSVDWRLLWGHRELLYFLALRDIKVRYKQTVFGVAWAVLQPVLTMAIFAVFFGRFAGLRATTGGVPYPLYVFTGLLPWMFFSTGVTGATNSIITSANLITKVYFPRLVIPFASVGVSVVDMGVSLGVLGLLFGFYRWMPSWHLILLPVVLLGVTLFTLGVGAVLSALTVAYRDFRYVVPFLLQTWMFITPVIYPASIIPARFRWVLWCNPVAGLVDGMRAAMLGSPVDLLGLNVALAGSAAVFWLGVSYFRSVERRFADII
jgi:lipopolysaccharide transport system permease protein